MIQVYHNNRCSKSRECVLELKNQSQEFEIINYLETPPSAAEIKVLHEKLQIQPIELVRKKEALWVTNYKGKALTDQQIIEAMAQNPILIERPIVINGDKATIARPFEKAFDVL